MLTVCQTTDDYSIKRICLVNFKAVPGME